MCGTCGCGTDENGAIIQKPGDNAHYHIKNGHQHHDHMENSHSHEHSHEHLHEHSHNHTFLKVEQDILKDNDIRAAGNRGYFEAKNIFALNLVSSPGSGKTTLLEQTLKDLKEKFPFYVIEGDQQTLNDANRIDALKIPVIQINTGKGCHLESNMVYEAIKKLRIKNNAVLLIENVGNLVCPSMFDLGENKRIVIVSVTEGDDKPLKYPDMFFTSHICIINKIDLIPYVNFDIEKFKTNTRKINPHIQFFEISATTGEGLKTWYDWLKNNYEEITITKV
ncbi:hydrogenase nickel incorporation protein HypB [Abyssalbus ytuae]|uniref:Hydrogenase nickel incorporation protein HypB n=1 Tax=Abyssalbus ytuae TaxID=2926907 RepID=A0A9E6ZUP8_9FLAO|nr:hydrogenase nickel incorporation protein HypB [Abyssalbus ytuae]UOB17101.1 hydrogenase nickel incorporation protein HypB [Abyssalbus ytuae]